MLAFTLFCDLPYMLAYKPRIFCQCWY